MKIYSFLSYKGGAGRTSACLDVASALSIQGANVVVVDLDFEAPGLPIFSSVKSGSSFVFQPENLFPIGKSKSIYTLQSERRELDIITLPGLLSVFKKVGYGGGFDFDFDKLPVYEYRHDEISAIEGKTFIIPLGGSFKKAANSPVAPDATPWIYYPPAKDELKTLFLLRDNDPLLDGNVKFFDLLRMAIESRLSSVKSAIDYLLLDERPGMVIRNLIANTMADGIVLVSSGSRGNLAGVKSYLEILNSKNADGKFFYPKVVGLVIAPLLSSTYQSYDDGSHDAVKVLSDNMNQIGWNDYLRILFRDERLDLPKMDKQNDYINLFFNESLADDTFLNVSEPSVTKGKSLWFRGQRQFGGKDQEYFDAFVPVLFDNELQVHDKLLDFRSNLLSEYLDKTEENSPAQHNIKAILTLAGHLRSRDKTEDKSYQAWRLWQDSQEGKSYKTWKLWQDSREGHINETGWADVLAGKNCPWRVFLYRALTLKHRGELKESIEYFDKAKKAQDRLILPDKPWWKGDWRILKNRGEVHLKLKSDSEKNELTLAISDFKKALDCVTNGFGDTLASKVESKINRLKAKIEIAIGDVRVEQGKLWKAFDEYEKSIDKIVRTDDFPRVFEKIIQLLARLESVEQGKSSKLKIIYRDLIEKCEREMRGVFEIRDRLYLPVASLQFSLFRQEEDSSKEKDKLLDNILKYTRDWELKKNEGRIHEDDPRAAMLQGGVFFCLALKQKDTLFYNYIIQALEKWDEATKINPDNLNSYLNLSLAKLTAVTKKRQQVSGMKNGNERKQQEEMCEIMERDAFYAVEQTLALCLDRENADFYFNGEVAVTMGNNLPGALMLAANYMKYDEEQVFSKIEFDHFFNLADKFLGSNSLVRDKQILAVTLIDDSLKKDGIDDRNKYNLLTFNNAPAINQISI